MKYYSYIADGYDELHMEEQKKKLDILKKNLDLKGLVLDVGSGTGISQEYFKNIVLLEPSIELIKQSSGCRVCAMAEHLPFKDNVFEGIISITVLHHVNLKKTIDEIKRVSKNQTRLAFSVFKKANNFSKICSMLKKEFNLKDIDEEKDLIMIN